MKISELFTEDIITFDEQQFEKDCAFFIKESHGLKMYRGAQKDFPSGTFRPFKKREDPVNSPMRLHDQVNDFFMEKFGQPFRNGLFATGDLGMARSYGHPYIVVPKGRFFWLCNTEIPDMTESLYSEFAHEQGLEEYYAINKTLDAVEKSKKWIDSVDLKQCIESKCEIMLWCSHGYYLFKDDENLPNILKSRTT